MTDTPAPPTLYSEKKLAQKIGVTRADAKATREAVLERDRHWQLDKGTVVITAAGLPLFLESLAQSLETPPATAEECADCRHGEIEPAQTLAELEVTRIWPNVRLLQARTPEGHLVNVQVKSNENFMPRMRLQARPVSGSMWKLEGRCPRRKGRY